MIIQNFSVMNYKNCTNYCKKELNFSANLIPEATSEMKKYIEGVEKILSEKGVSIFTFNDPNGHHFICFKTDGTTENLLSLDRAHEPLGGFSKGKTLDEFKFEIFKAISGRVLVLKKFIKEHRCFEILKEIKLPVFEELLK